MKTVKWGFGIGILIVHQAEDAIPSGRQGMDTPWILRIR